MILQTILPKTVSMNYFFQNKCSKLLACLLLCLCQTFSYAQHSPKRELRAVWIATVLNIDFPSTNSTNEWTLKEDWIKLLEKHKAMGINALYVQIRPVADAFYPSAVVPWSSYLSGKSGAAPANNFDPLAFMISSAHGYGFEFHAWLNPYRASMDNQTSADFAPNHVMQAHPDWCVRYGKRYVMNPGLPEVRAHFNEVVAEIVQKYDVDGIHFDDYFYPYKNGNEQFADWQTYQKYGAGFPNIDDWRRNNVDLMVYGVSKLIKKIRPKVQFGISPFGVWRNFDKDPEGSKTRAGLTCYDDLYADVRKWLRSGWIDYVAPQVYWNIGFPVAEFKTIVNWWADNSAGKPIYVGLAAYRLSASGTQEAAWRDPAELGRQISFTRSLKLKGVKGVAFFSSKSLTANPLGIIDTLNNNYFNAPAMTPQVVKDSTLLACESPEIRDVIAKNGEVMLRWKPSMTTLRRRPFQYIIYRFENGQIDFTNGKNILARIPCASNHLEYFDKTIEDGMAYTYAITVVDIQNQESPAETLHEIGQVKTTKSPDITSKSGSSVKKDKKAKRCGFFRRLFGGC
jgi:uncharacterized lipoprotein YddW (UPF0748 family)